MSLLFRLLVNMAAILLSAALVPGIHVSGLFATLFVVIVLGLINMTLKPILLLLTLPINILTLGLFTFIINALMLWLAAGIVPGFKVDGFGPAFLGALVITIVHWFVHSVESRRRPL